MSTPQQHWIKETNTLAADGPDALAERLASRLLGMSGPSPTADDINWLDLILDAYDEADEMERAAYAQVMLDWLGNFQFAFGRSGISAEAATLTCSALSFWQARPAGFTVGEQAYIRAFLRGYLDSADTFRQIPSPLNDAGGVLYEQIVRLHYFGPGAEYLEKSALLAGWLRVEMNETNRPQALARLRNNRNILEALARYHPEGVSYDWVHRFFRESKVLPEDERMAFLEHTFTRIDVSDAWTLTTSENQVSPRTRLLSELRHRFRSDDFDSIEETLRFMDQIFWLAGDPDGEFARWKEEATVLVLKDEAMRLRDKILPGSAYHPEESCEADSLDQQYGLMMEYNIFAAEQDRQNGEIEQVKLKEKSRKFVFHHQQAGKRSRRLSSLPEVPA